ncbi:MAG: metallophosphoesterase [Lachnospiraceae bacterium]|nr:metallophosphoesterase [Lachnospiraceae bacterium]
MGYYYRKSPRVASHIYYSRKIKRKLTFAVLSDLHNCVFGPHNENIIKAVTSCRPDAVIIAGDFITAGDSLKDAMESFLLLKELCQMYPVYFGLGNHERKCYDMDCFKKSRPALSWILDRSGAIILRNSYTDLGDSGVRIYGLDLSRRFYRKVVRHRLPHGYLNSLLGIPPSDKYNLLIAHNPEHFKDYSVWGPDLTLSGHVHGGIVRPPGCLSPVRRLYYGQGLGHGSKRGWSEGVGLLSPACRLFPRYDAGEYKIGNSRLLVSRGLGTHSINLRVNNPPEVLKVELRPF